MLQRNTVMIAHLARRKLAMTLALSAAPSVASACEPILPLVHLMAGATAVGPLLFLHSLAWLGIAVAIKCASFIALERRLPWGKALLFMFTGNLLSTLP